MREHHERASAHVNDNPGAINRQLAVRLAVFRALSRARDLDGIYNGALDALAECLDVARASVLLFDPDGVMRFKAYRGLSSEYRAAVQGHSPWAPDSLIAEPMLVPDVTREPSLEPYLPAVVNERIAAMAFIPFVSVGRIIGKFMLYYDSPHVFTEEEVQLARVIAAAVAFAVERARGDDVAPRSHEPRGKVATVSAGPWAWEASALTVQWTEGRDGRGGALRQVNECQLETSRDCLKVLEFDGRLTYINPAGVRLLGLDSDREILNRSWVDLWPDKERAAVRDALARAEAGGVGRFHGPFTSANGLVTWWDVAITPIVDAGGRIAQLLAISRSVSAPWQDESLRAGQHQVLEMIATDAPLAEVLTLLVHLIEDQCDDVLSSVVLLDPDGVHMRQGASPSLPETYTRSVNGMAIGPDVGSCGTTMHFGRQVIVSDIASDPRWAMRREAALAHGLRACWSAPILSPQNEVLGAFAMYCTTARGPSREELLLSETAADLAGIAIEHHQTQEALRRSEERNRAILRAIPDWMFILDRNGIFLDWHGHATTDLLAPPEEFLGKSARDILPPSLADAHQQALERALRTNEPEIFDYSLDFPGGQRFYEACIVRCDTDKVLSIVRDITERRLAELDAAVHRQEIAHLNRVAVAGELSGTLAHELSQPLAAILANAQASQRLLTQSAPDIQDVLAALDDVIRNSKRAGAVIHGLRNMLKKGDDAPQPLNLNEVIEEVLALMRSDLLVRRISVRKLFATELPPVLGDRVQLQQVVLNLMLNACDAMIEVEPADRRVTLRTAVDGGLVHVSVSDRGPGIPGDHLAAVFEPFVTFRKQGLGLGLSISRSIVLSHRGRILAENNADRGATFRCVLPAAPARAPVQAV